MITWQLAKHVAYAVADRVAWLRKNHFPVPPELAEFGRVMWALSDALRELDPAGPSYKTAHRRVHQAKGSASEHPCAHCGGQSVDWAYDHKDPEEITDQDSRLVYSAKPEHYLPLCKRCQGAFDAEHRRLEAANGSRDPDLAAEAAAGQDVPVLLLTRPAAAKVLGCSPRKLSALTASGELRAVGKGRGRRWRVADVERYVEAIGGDS